MYSPAVGPFSADILTLCLSSTFGAEQQPHPIHLHRCHQAHQHGWPAQTLHQPWRRKQQGDGQANLDHFPKEKTEHCSTRVCRCNTTGQSTRKQACRQQNCERAVTGRPSNILFACQSPCGDSHSQAHARLTCQNTPDRHRGGFFSQPLCLFGTQGLEIRLLRLHLRIGCD